MSSKRAHIYRVRLAGEIDGFAFIAMQTYPPMASHLLEYYFLRRVVHAGLAKIVRGCAAAIRFLIRQDECAFVNLIQRVLRPLLPPLLKLSNACTEFSFVVFERLNLIAHRRRFLLQVQRGVLYVEDFDGQILRSFGDFVFVARGDGGAGNVPRTPEGGKACAQCGQRFHGGSPCFEKVCVGTTDSKRGADPHPHCREGA